MAQGEASIVVRLVDKASAGLKSLGGAVDFVRDHFLALSASVGAATAFLAASVKAFSEQEDAVHKLELALRNQGVTSKTVSRDLQAYADSLQRTTTFSDETILAGQALLVSFGLTGDKLKQATVASLDLAAGLGVDLRTAMMLVGKAAQGQTETLARYGIKIKEGTADSDKFSVAIQGITSKFGGSAQAEAETLSGKIKQLSISFNELQESIGEKLAPATGTFTTWLTSSINKITEYVKSQDALGKASSDSAASIAAQAASLDKYGAAIPVELQKELNEALKEEAKILEGKQAKGGNVEKLSTETDELGFALAEQARLRIESLQGVSREAQAIKDEELARQLQADGQLEAAAALKHAKDKERLKDRLDITKSTLSAVASLSNAKSKEIAAIGKAAAVAQATMDTFAAANKALAQGGFFGFAMAALVTAAGMANVARISGVELAQGGVVLPRAGGTQAIIGEAGRAEAVIPLGDRRAQEQIGAALGGGLTVNINAGTVVADKTSAAEFARMIDEELYKLGRNRKNLGGYA